MNRAFIGIGSNLGDREANIRHAVERLKSVDGIHDIRLSPLYETEPIGVTDQPDFLNAAITLKTALSPEDLLDVLLETERRLGRVRRIRWGPRLIDLDLLLYESETRNAGRLTLPHPRFRRRAFVTIPLLDLLRQPDLNHTPWNELARELAAIPTDDSVRPWKKPS